LLFATGVHAVGTWTSVPSKINVFFPQAEREDPNHQHSEKILINLDNMTGLPEGCRTDYVYINKDDTHLYSLFLAALMAKQTVKIAATDHGKAGGICRVTMMVSPDYL